MKAPNPETFFDMLTCNKDETAPKCEDSDDEIVKRCKACVEVDGEIVCKPDTPENCRTDLGEGKTVFEFNGQCLIKEMDTEDCYKQRTDLTWVDEQCGNSCIKTEFTQGLSLNFKALMDDGLMNEVYGIIGFEWYGKGA